MATYKKKLKTLEVHQMLDGQAVTIADTASDDMATRALNEFKAYETMHYKDGEDETAIPYHAVQYIKVTETEADITKADPYGCDEGADTYTIKWILNQKYGTCTGQGVIVQNNVAIGDELDVPDCDCTTTITDSYWSIGYIRYSAEGLQTLTDEIAGYAVNKVIEFTQVCSN